MAREEYGFTKSPCSPLLVKSFSRTLSISSRSFLKRLGHLLTQYPLLLAQSKCSLELLAGIFNDWELVWNKSFQVIQTLHRSAFSVRLPTPSLLCCLFSFAGKNPLLSFQLIFFQLFASFIIIWHEVTTIHQTLGRVLQFREYFQIQKIIRAFFFLVPRLKTSWSLL